jgi:RNA-directed DNA polymerase
MSSVTRLLTTKLKLRVNSEKSAVARPWERKFLGFSFTNHKQPKRRLAPKAVARFKERVRELTSRTRGISLGRMVHDLAEYLRGWIGYFGRCQTPEVLNKLEKWLRRRLRSMVWKQWKRGTTRYRELRKPGIAAQDAHRRHHITLPTANSDELIEIRTGKYSLNEVRKHCSDNFAAPR